MFQTTNQLTLFRCNGTLFEDKSKWPPAEPPNNWVPHVGCQNLTVPCKDLRHPDMIQRLPDCATNVGNFRQKSRQVPKAGPHCHCHSSLIKSHCHLVVQRFSRKHVDILMKNGHHQTTSFGEKKHMRQNFIWFASQSGCYHPIAGCTSTQTPVVGMNKMALGKNHIFWTESGTMILVSKIFFTALLMDLFPIHSI